MKSRLTRSVRHKTALIHKADGSIQIVRQFDEELDAVESAVALKRVELGATIWERLKVVLPERTGDDVTSLQVDRQIPEIISENAVGVLFLGIRTREGEEPPTDEDLARLVQQFKMMP